MRSKSMNVLLAMAVQLNMDILQFDISKAFCHADCEEEVHIEQPAPFVIKGKEDYVYRLNKHIYGLKTSPSAYSKHMSKCMRAVGMRPADSDECLWVMTRGDKRLYVLYHVDDILMASNDNDLRLEIFKKLRDEQQLLIREEGVLDKFLAMRTIYHDDGSISLSQSEYIEKLADRFRIDKNCREEVPGLPGIVLSKDDLPQTEQEAKEAAKLPYPALIGCLIYLVKSRPDLAFPISDLARFMSSWGQKHFRQALRVLRYAFYTRETFLTFRKRNGEMLIRAYVDANFGDPRDTGLGDKWKSQGGYLIYLDGNLVHWSSKRHKCVTLSSMEAEYVEASKCGQEMLWFRRLMCDLGFPQRRFNAMYEDNKACISFSRNHTCHDRSKHIDIRHHWLRELVVEQGIIKLGHVKTDEQIADVMTKYLPKGKFLTFRDKMLKGVEEFPEIVDLTVHRLSVQQVKTFFNREFAGIECL